MNKSSRGFSLVEIILAAAIFSIFFASIGLYFSRGLKLSEQTTRRIQASYLLEEGINVMRLLRDSGWNASIATLSTTTTYHLYWNGSSWRPTTTPQLIENIFTRTFSMSDVYRDSNDDIVSSGGSYDAQTKKVTFFVSWTTENGVTATDTVQTYIPNLFKN